MTKGSPPSTSDDLVLALDGDLDAICSDSVERQLLDAIATGRPVVVDLTDVTFCDSRGLAIFLKAHGQADELGSSFTLRNMPANMTRLFDVTGLTEHFFPA